MANTNKGQSSKKKSQAKVDETAKKKRKPGELSTFQRVVIIIFVVVFALSTLAGALASVFQSQNSTTQVITDEEINAMYEDTVVDLEAKVEANPEDAESLLSLAQNCREWGTMLTYISTVEEDAAKGEELIQRALGYSEQCLELQDSAEARFEKAMCERQLDDDASAMVELGEITTNYPDYAPAWLQLGSLYEAQGMTEEAAAAYQSAIDADADGEQGVKENAEQYLERLQSSSEEAGDADASDETDANATDTESSDQAGEASQEAAE